MEVEIMPWPRQNACVGCGLFKALESHPIFVKIPLRQGGNGGRGDALTSPECLCSWLLFILSRLWSCTQPLSREGGTEVVVVP